MHISMVVFGDLRYDYRVFREVTALRGAGHEVSLVASAFSDASLELWRGVALHLLPVDRSLSLRQIYPLFWQRAYRKLLSIPADAYHAHDLDTLWPAARAARRRGVPLVYDTHEFWTEQSSLVQRTTVRAFWERLERRFIKRAAHVITVSPSIAQVMQARYGLERVALLRNLPVYKEPILSNRIRNLLHLPDDRPIALYQGGFLTDNGLSEQIEAARHFDKAVLVLIGGGPNEVTLKEQVQRSGLGNRVFFLPRVPFEQLHEYTCSADIGLCLIKRAGNSFYYSLPNKLFEYFIAGLPVLVSDFPEMSSIVKNAGAGIAIDPSNPFTIAQVISSLVADESLMDRYRTAARRAASHYNWEKERHVLTDLYADL